MNKTDLVKVIKDTVSETLDGVTVKDTAIFVDATIKAIQDAVVAGLVHLRLLKELQEKVEIHLQANHFISKHRNHLNLKQVKLLKMQLRMHNLKGCEIFEEK